MKKNIIIAALLVVAAMAQAKHVDPLLKTKWNQEEPYNCVYGGGRFPTGCGPTALAQIMNYWQWPKQGYGNHANPHLESQKVNFGQSVYDWSHMLGNYQGDYTETEAQAVGKLMYDIGCAVEVSWGALGGSSIFHDLAKALVKYFGYDVNLCHYGYEPGSKPWPTDDCHAMLKQELDAGRPFLYGTSSPLTGDAHFVVCDGYNEEGLFHLNYGWGGSYDDWYYIPPTSPEVIIGIQPPKHAPVVVGNAYYTPMDNGEAAVTGITANADIDVQPKVSIEGKDYPVTRIYDYAFFQENITGISLPGSIKQIPMRAVAECDQLTSITLNEGLREIGDSAFYLCPKLQQLPVLPSTLQSIGDLTFYRTSTKDNIVHIPASVKTIGKGAFGTCEMEAVWFDGKGFTVGDACFGPVKSAFGIENAAAIGSYGFGGGTLEGTFTVQPTCRYADHAVVGRFNSILIPAAVANFDVKSVVGTASYEVENGHPSLSTIGDMLCSKDRKTLLVCPDYKLENGTMYDRGSIIIPAGIETIANRACGEAITNAIIPATVKATDGAFLICGDLRDVTCLATTPPSGLAFNEFSHEKWETKLSVPNGSGSAYRQAEGWKNFRTITDDKIFADGQFYFEPYPMFSSATLIGRKADASFNGKAEVPATVTLNGTTYSRIDLDNAAFQGDAELRSISLPKSITYIPFEAFMNCPALSAVSMTDEVSSIGTHAFAHCPQLRSITLPKGISEIEREAFAGSGLQEVKIQATDYYIRENSFADCTALRSVQGLEGAKWIADRAFLNSGLEGNIVFGSYLQNIGSEAFSGTLIESVMLPASLTTFNSNAFANCGSLYEVNVAADNTRYYSTDGMLFGKGDKTLYFCPDMQRTGSTISLRDNVVIPEGTLALGYQALGAKVNSVTLPASLTDVGYGLTACQNLSRATNLSTTPQAATDNWTFPISISRNEKNTAQLLVPKGCVETYRNAAGWRKFGHIYEIGNVPTGVIDIEHSSLNIDHSTAVYDLGGRRVANPAAKGLYIIGNRKVVKQ